MSVLLHCTAECSAETETTVFLSIPTAVSSHQLKHHITVFSKHQYIRQQYVIATQILNTVFNLKDTSSEWLIRNVQFMCDVQTVAMITDMPAAFKVCK